MSTINPALLTFFANQYKPGAIALIGTNDLIGEAIRSAEAKITPDGGPSLWSHCCILGDQRWDLRGPGGVRAKSIYLFESDLVVNLLQPQVRNGAQESWIGKWCGTEVENAAVIDFGLTDDQQENVFATALQLVDDQVLYPIQSLLGTWWAIITSRQWQENPLNDPHAMYCSSFVRYCYAAAGKDFLGPEVSVSNTAPENIAQAAKAGGAMVVFNPPPTP